MRADKASSPTDSPEKADRDGLLLCRSVLSTCLDCRSFLLRCPHLKGLQVLSLMQCKWAHHATLHTHMHTFVQQSLGICHRCVCSAESWVRVQGKVMVTVEVVLVVVEEEDEEEEEVVAVVVVVAAAVQVAVKVVVVVLVIVVVVVVVIVLLVMVMLLLLLDF